GELHCQGCAGIYASKDRTVSADRDSGSWARPHSAVDCLHRPGGLRGPTRATVGGPQQNAVTDRGSVLSIAEKDPAKMVRGTAGLPPPRDSTISGSQNDAICSHRCPDIGVYEAYAEQIVDAAARLPRPGRAAIGRAKDRTGAGHGRSGIRIREGDA